MLLGLFTATACEPTATAPFVEVTPAQHLVGGQVVRVRWLVPRTPESLSTLVLECTTATGLPNTNDCSILKFFTDVVEAGEADVAVIEGAVAPDGRGCPREIPAACTVVVVHAASGGPVPFARTPIGFTSREPLVSVTPRAGGPGSPVVVEGLGFAPGENVDVSYLTGVKTIATPPTVALCSATASPDGAVGCEGALPSRAGPSGGHTVVASGQDSFLQGETTFTLTR